MLRHVLSEHITKAIDLLTFSSSNNSDFNQTLKPQEEDIIDFNNNTTNLRSTPRKYEQENKPGADRRSFGDSHSVNVSLLDEFDWFQSKPFSSVLENTGDQPKQQQTRSGKSKPNLTDQNLFISEFEGI